MNPAPPPDGPRPGQISLVNPAANPLVRRAPLPEPLPAPELSPLMRAPSVLLIGPPGSGKTHSIVTLMLAGLEVFDIVTEPNGLEVLVDAMYRNNVQAERLRYRVIEPAREDFGSLGSMAVQVTQMGYDGLSKMAPTERSKAQFLQVLNTCSNFVDDRTGQAFGNVSHFGPDRCVVLDSLSGLNLMAMDLTIGNKVTAHQGEWGVAMNMLDKLLLTMTSNLRCLFVLTAHLEPERDELTGTMKWMASTLGRKLAPRIPRFFSEVVLCYPEGTEYYWSTTHPNMDLKHRSLPHGNRLAPNFSPIVNAYAKRLEHLKGTNTP